MSSSLSSNPRRTPRKLRSFGSRGEVRLWNGACLAAAQRDGLPSRVENSLDDPAKDLLLLIPRKLLQKRLSPTLPHCSKLWPTIPQLNDGLANRCCIHMLKCCTRPALLDDRSHGGVVGDQNRNPVGHVVEQFVRQRPLVIWSAIKENHPEVHARVIPSQF